MAKKKNTLTPYVQALHRALSIANYAAFAADGAANRDTGRAQKLISDGKGNWLLTFAALAGQDIYSEEPSSIAYGGGGVKGSDVPLLIQESITASQLNALENAYEAMDTFVKLVSGDFLYGKRGDVPILQKWRQQMRKRFGKGAAAENTPQYCHQIARTLAGHNCTPLFDLLFDHVSTLRERVAATRYGDLHDIHLAIEGVRHCSTHANGLYLEEDYVRLPKMSRVIIESLVRDSFIHKDKRILPAHNEVSNLLGREAEYGQLIYDGVSNALAMEVDYMPGHRYPKK